MDFLRYRTSSPAGDLIAMLPALRQAYRKSGRKVIIYQRLNMIGNSEWRGIHAFHDEEGFEVCMPQTMFNNLRPLLLAQSYIEDYIIYNGQEVDYNLDILLNEVFTNKPYGCISRWIFYGFPDLTCDLSEQWIHAIGNEYSLDNKIIINHTERYRNRFISYFFLKRYEKDLVFVGLPKEYDRFSNEWDIYPEYLQVDSFLELASYIASCKFFLGNQSMCFQIAEGLKVPRILEAFAMMPNVIPVGKDAYDFHSQKAVEFLVHDLFNR